MNRTLGSRQSLLGQFLVPVLSAVLAIGISIAFVSRWFADRAAEKASLDRMKSTGRLVVNAPFRLTPQVLDQIQQLTQLDLALVSITKDASPNIIASTSAIPSGLAKQLDWVVPGRSSSELLHLGEVDTKPFLAVYVSAGNNHLVVLERVKQTSFLNLSFWLPLVTGLISAIGIGIVATWTASRLTRRISVLKTEVEAIAEGQVIEKPIIGPSDDIRSLQMAIHKMSHELGESKKQIASNERARLIQLMASGLVHELRNHLTGAKLALQTCTISASNSEAISIASQQMDLAERQLRRLLAVQARGDVPDEPALSPLEILATVVELIRPMAQHHNVHLDVFPPLDPPMSSDATLSLRTIPSGSSVTGAILNLMINAIEAACPNGYVRLCVNTVSSDSISNRKNSIEAGHCKVVKWSVRDNGPGIPEDIASILFEPFVTTKPEGVGLGLAMCKRVVHSLGGQIDWRRDGQETVFEIQIPIK